MRQLWQLKMERRAGEEQDALLHLTPMFALSANTARHQQIPDCTLVLDDSDGRAPAVKRPRDIGACTLTARRNHRHHSRQRTTKVLPLLPIPHFAPHTRKPLPQHPPPPAACPPASNEGFLH